MPCLLFASVAFSAFGSVSCGGKLTSPTDHAVFLSRVTGPTSVMSTCPEDLQLPSTNDTSARWDIGGADLGITWDNGRGEIVVAFGDTFKFGDTTASPQRFTDWRHNAIGFSTDKTPYDGITISRMLEDRPGHAREIIGRSAGVTQEQSVVPTAGIAIGSRNYMFYMSVKQWGAGSGWVTNYSSIVYSDDGGETWTPSDARWPSASRFAQTGLAFDGGYLYVMGTPAARKGALHLARVSPDDVLDPTKYEYFTGSDWALGDETKAGVLAPAPVGEISIHKNAGSGLWQLTYLNFRRQAIVLRTAPELTGPWSAERVLIETRDPAHPGVYGGFQHPWFNDGPDVFLTVAKRVPCYDTFLVDIPAMPMDGAEPNTVAAR